MDKMKKLTAIFICAFAIVLPAEMIKGQTYEVDATSGATITSNGIKDAVARCLEQASNF